LTAHGGKPGDITIMQLENSTKYHQGRKNKLLAFVHSEVME